MHQYRIYTFREDGHFSTVQRLECADERVAVRKARQFVSREDGELWDQSLRLTEITRKLRAEAGNATHFVVFDACRNTLKLKTADFRQRTRAQSIHAPTQLAAKIFAVSREMLAKEIDGTAFRLMGTGVSALRPGSQADDSDMLDRRSAHAERAIDDLRKKFGNAAVIRGIAYDGPEGPGEEV